MTDARSRSGTEVKMTEASNGESKFSAGDAPESTIDFIEVLPV